MLYLRMPVKCCLAGLRVHWCRSLQHNSETPAVRAATWEHFPHDADIGVRGHGKTVEEAFEQSALALTTIVTDVPIGEKVSVEVTCDAPDLELLLVEWLNAIIYEMAVLNVVFGRFKVVIDGTHLHGTLRGEPIDQSKHAPACEPKGATYTALRVIQETDGTWSAGCVVDV
jgi:SHS2 domain-containing protein